jgi:hypothetical protein
MPFVDPRSVEAMRARLAPAFASLGQGATPGTERARLSAEGLAWCHAAPCGLIDAPRLFEHGRDLEARLAFAQGPHGAAAARPARAGEVLGMHTVGELADLIAAETYQLTALGAMKPCAKWAAADPVGYGTWAAAVFDTSASLTKAIAQAQSVVDVTPSSLWSVTPAHGVLDPFLDPWGDLIAAAHPMGDLIRQFIQAGYCVPPDMSGMPQPKSPDLDLSAYRWTDMAAKKIEKVADAIGSTGGGVVIGIVIAVGLFAFVKIAR